MSITFDGRVAVVTGAGGGLGRTYALELARRGAAVVVNDLGGSLDGAGSSASAADKVVEEIRVAGGRAIAEHSSVATPQGGAAIVDAALREFGRLDVVINNAGILRDRSAGKLSSEDVDGVLDVHLRGAFNVSLPAFRVMKEQRYGRLLFTTSVAGLLGNFGQANYSAAKMGLVGLASTLSIEGERSGILANCIAPVALTRMTEALMPADSRDVLRADYVTPLAVYLVSEQCQETREIFSVGGGRYARFFVAVTPGIHVGESTPTVEDLAARLPEIRDLSEHLVLRAADEEVALLAKSLPANPVEGAHANA
ncbi:SDR family oxidoreductase [Dactylosporangium sucinum]|uniref:Serine/threonine protein kinase n=1 Tax=Dactylosporangium sucinum TaxID=1424081 RepID=A0A917UCT3_9ACTN|nr:SDR family oxidoreductase [Dactylosporangium sucinum]GGM82736.1 serine/threonine protein kinase [Dactylosporangium sucinum]